MNTLLQSGATDTRSARKRTEQSTRPRRQAVGVVIALALTGVLTACSSSDSGNSPATGSGAGGSNSAGIAKAKQAVAAATKTQTAIQLPALKSRPPAGKTIELISCPLPICNITFSGAQLAAKALNWKVKNLTTQFSPESYVSTFNQVVTDKPDYLAYVGLFPNSTVRTQLQALKANGTKVVSVSGADVPDDLMQANYNGEPTIQDAATLMGNALLAAPGGPGSALILTLASANKKIWGPGHDAFEKAVKAGCSSCKFTVLNLEVANIGRVVPGQVVSALQRDPSIKFIFADNDDYYTGVYQALQSAGLSSKVKLIGHAPNVGTLKAIANGQQYATVAIENSAIGWRMVDGLARLGEGTALGSCCTSPVGFRQLIVKSNVPSGSGLDANKLPTVPGEPDAFLKAWHVS